MALIINVSSRKESDVRPYRYLDASFKTIGNVLPVYSPFTQEDVREQGSRRYVPAEEPQRRPRAVFTSSGRRYALDPQSVQVLGGVRRVYLDRVLAAEGLDEVDGEWRIQYGGLYPAQDNSLRDVDAIRNSIRNIFLFSLRERIIMPDFGSCLGDVIGSTMTDGQLVVVKEMVEKMMNWEPRISLDDVSVSFDPDQYLVIISVRYSVPGLDVAPDVVQMNVSVKDQ